MANKLTDRFSQYCLKNRVDLGTQVISDGCTFINSDLHFLVCFYSPDMEEHFGLLTNTHTLSFLLSPPLSPSPSLTHTECAFNPALCGMVTWPPHSHPIGPLHCRVIIPCVLWPNQISPGLFPLQDSEERVWIGAGFGIWVTGRTLSPTEGQRGGRTNWKRLGGFLLNRLVDALKPNKIHLSVLWVIKGHDEKRLPWG